MKVFIAEKPSLGKAIAEGLGAGARSDGYIQCGPDIVTWCFGHLLDSAPPEHYNAAWKKWTRDSLPMLPERFALLERPDAKKQIQTIRKLLSGATCVVNAGDPDREGQLLVDELLEHLGWKGRCERIWLASLDPESVRKALAALKDNSGYRGFRDAADVRRQMDWLGGMNLTRAMTIFGRDMGISGVLSLGRVQTPTLALIVARDREIENFKPVDFAVVKCLMKYPAGDFMTEFMAATGMEGTDPQGRLVNFAIAEKIRADAENRPGEIVKAEYKTGKDLPPLAYALSTLQKECASSLGLSAQQTLDVAQKLYEAKLTTYPRTDCGYLPAEQFGDAPKVLKGLSEVEELATIAAGANPSLKSQAWNTKQITAHHGIIPTGISAASLTGREREVYLLIASRYIAQFYPPLEYRTANIDVKLDNGTSWNAKGRVVTNIGWKICLLKKSGKEDKVAALPAVKQGDSVKSGKAEIEKRQTKPPSRFSEGTLIEAMSGIHLYVADKEAKARLKETSGLGTEATRAGIIETLKKRGYIEAKGKNLVSTDTGRNVIALCPASVKDIVTTALMEDDLAEIQAGKKRGADVLLAYRKSLGPMIDGLFNSDAGKIGVKVEVHPCPKCGKAMGRRKGKAGFFWGCSGYPDCQVIMTDEKGKPGTVIERKPKAEPPVAGEFKCPLCKGKLTYGISKTGKSYWACFAKSAKHGKDKNVKFWDVLPDGKPNFK